MCIPSGGSAGTVLTVFDEAGHLIGEYSSTGALVQETIWLGDTPVATIRPGTPAVVYYVHADHLNAPRMVTQSLASNSKVAWRWDTDPFGTPAPNQNPAGLGTFVFNLRYPGQYYDSETGLSYNMARDYDPQVGRYVESDPIGLRGGLNTYAYVENSPVGQFDPTGLAVSGAWIQAPRLNLVHVGVNWGATRIVAPHISGWGYIKFIQLNASASGYVNLDVRCTDDCQSWEVHQRVNVDTSGTFEIGPNLYALAIGLSLRSPWLGVAANISIAGAAALHGEYQVLQAANQKAGPIIAAALAYGPTAICLGSR